MSAELVELAAKFHQKGSESIVVWLLCLWDTSANGFTLSGDELTQMATVTTYSSLHQHIHRIIQYAENVLLLN